jgi:hypothetical protein
MTSPLTTNLRMQIQINYSVTRTGEANHISPLKNQNLHR